MILMLLPEQAVKITQQLSRFNNTISFAEHYFSVDSIEFITGSLVPSKMLLVRFICGKCCECHEQGKVCNSDDVMRNYVINFLT